MSRSAARLLGALVLVLAGASAQVRADVFISEICDPHLNYASDRFIEIYNPGPAAVDLTGWRLVAVANGVDVFTWNLSGTIASQQALVAGDATTVTVFPVAFPDEAWSGANGNWNGRVGDGARLVSPTDVVTDYMVATGTAFENCDYVRNPTVEAPSPVYVATEWTATPVELATDASPGTHSTGSPPAGPAIAGIHTDPALPMADVLVHVLAEVTDPESDITTVNLAWGTAPDALSAHIAMGRVSADTFRTWLPIPGQPAGTTVYYQVEAANDLPATTTSPLQSYALGYEVTVHQVQGEAPVSPYDGQVVVTQGVVTGAFGATYVIQDGSGAWNGLWVTGAAPAVGELVTVTGRVSESATPATAGNTVLADAQVVASAGTKPLPAAVEVATAEAGSEAYEGVLVRVGNARCTAADPGGGPWQVDDGSGAASIGVLGYLAAPTLGSAYTVSGPVTYAGGAFRIEPRGAADVLWAGDTSAPVLLRAVPLSPSKVRVVFSEPVETASATATGNYQVGGLTVAAASREPGHPDRIDLTVSPMTAGDYELTATGVADLFANPTAGTDVTFTWYERGEPAGYYDPATGLQGDALKLALHQVIDDHVARSYDYAWTAYYTTDVRPDNSKLWDVYSDIPGGTPPYLYTIGVDQGGVGGEEGTGYSREHTWCKSWFGGEVSPMYTDLFILYPCDTHVNGTRGAYPYGETVAPQWTSLNGSKLGPSSVPGYTATVFEPRDDFKGDLARAYFYFSTRYYTEDASWPGGPATDGATILPWALTMFLRWSDEDPVCPKEIARNAAIYAIQGNRNPFVDRPEFIDLVFGPVVTTGVGGTETAGGLALLPAAPNPFNGATRIAFQLAAPARVTLRIYDLRGALVRELLDGELVAGLHEAAWDGRDGAGRIQPAGLYLYRLQTGAGDASGKLLMVR